MKVEAKGHKECEDTDVLCTETLMFPTVKRATNPLYITKIYALRYWVIRNLTCKVPYVPYTITKGKSLLEIVVIISTFGILLGMSQGYLTTKTSGRMAVDFACIMIIFALKNNALTMFLGISYERAIQYHKAAGVLTVLLAISHMILNERKMLEVEKSGIITLVLFTATSLSYLLKDIWFELFYYFHFCMYFVIAAMTHIHGAKAFKWTVVVWGFDALVRYYFGGHTVEADVTVLADGVVKISIPKSFEYSPGQYCFISVPALTHFQYHVSYSTCLFIII